MSTYLLDTSVIIDYFRGKPDAVKLLDTTDGEFFSSYICLAEIYEGIHRGSNKEKMAYAANIFFSSLSGMYGVDQGIAKKFGEIRANLKKKGNVIEDLDLLLAATCLVHGLTLMTYNKKHFSRIKDLSIYPV